MVQLAVVKDLPRPSDSNIRKKEHIIDKYQRLRDELEKTWRVKATVVSLVIRAFGAVTRQTG